MAPRTLARRFFAGAVTLAGLLLLSTGQPQAQTKEHFTALAVNLDRVGPAAATTVDINIDRWSTDAERTQLMTALAEKGPDKLLDVLQGMPRVGSIRTPDSIGYDLHFARRTLISNGAERIVIMTDRPIGFWEAAHRPRVSDYPFTVIEMHIAPDGKGEGKMSLATKITLDEAKSTIVLENYSAQPVLLNEVRRMK